MVTAIYGHAYDGKQIETFQECLDRIRRQAGGRCVYVVRSEARVRQLRDLVLAQLSGCFEFPVMTLPDLIKRLYWLLPDARRTIGPLEQQLLFEEIFKQRVQESGEQFCFHRFQDDWGILEKVQEFITQVRRAGIASRPTLEDRLRQCSPRRQAVYAELAQIFERYVQRLDAAHVIDETGVFLAVAEQAAVQQLDIRTLVATPELLVVEGYYDLTIPEQQILTACFAQFERTFLTLDLPLNPYTFPAPAEVPKPFRIFSTFARFVRDSGCSVRSTSPQRSSVQDSERIALVNALFGERSQTETAFPIEKVSVAAYRTAKDEVTAMARQIRMLSQTGKITTLREVGVTFPALEHYERLLAEIFPMFGVPFTVAQGRSLAASALAITILRILEVVRDDYSRASVRRLLSSPFVRFEYAPDESSTAPFVLQAETAYELDILAQTLGIENGRQTWIDALTHYQNDDGNTSILLASTGSASVPLASTGSASVPLASTGSASIPLTPSAGQRPALPIIPAAIAFLDFLAAFEMENQSTLKDWIERLQCAITRLQIPHCILRTPDRTVRETDAAALRVFWKVLETVKNARRGTCTFGEFYEFLRKAIQRETCHPMNAKADAVVISGRLDTRQTQFTYLFFGGLVEKDLPGTEQPNIFLSEQEAELMGVITYKQRLQETDYLLYANLLNPTAHLYLSYPLQEGENELLRSVYVDAMLRPQQTPGSPASLLAEQAGMKPAILADTLPDIPLEAACTYTEVAQWLGAALSRSAAEQTQIDAVLRLIEDERGAAWVSSFLAGVQAQAFRSAPQLNCFDGVLASDWAQQFLRQRYDRHVYSVAEFDRYVRCPLRFLFQYLLHLSPAPEIEEGVSALEFSKLLHRIVARFYAEAASCSENSCHCEESATKQSPDCGEMASQTVSNVDQAFLRRKVNQEEWRQEAKAKLARIVREELAVAPQTGVFWEQLSDLLLVGLNGHSGRSRRKLGILAAFLEQELADTDHPVPTYLNASFGSFGRSSADERDTANLPKVSLSDTPFNLHVQQDNDGRSVSIPLKGQIDRIDVEPESQTPPRRVVLYDYKTGGVPPAQDVREGLAFYMPLYLLAVQELFGAAYQVVAGGYYQIKTPTELGKKGFFGSKEYGQQGYFSGSSRSGLFETHAEFWQSVEDYKIRALHVVQAITAGRFPPTALGPYKAGCRYCDYQRICRVDHQRMERIGR